ncbi:MAG TPA: hypothetical protein VJL29_03685 [Thermoguttaceae bacterium]|nr:hypothetical protein [Thermoguttaceae bacterium]
MQPAAETPSAEQDAVFDLEAFNVLEIKDQNENINFRLGQREGCGHEPDKKVKNYPDLKSKKPWYGSIRLGRDPFKQDSGRLFHFVIDESEGTGKGYDLLFFDADGDLDLTNDPVLRPMKDPPPGAAIPWKSKQMVPFDYLSVDFIQDPGMGKNPLKMMPRLTVSEYEKTKYGSVSFVPAVARRGKIRIGAQEFNAILGHDAIIVGRFDSIWTGLQLTPIDKPKNREYWWGADRLGSMRHVDGRWYSLAASPSGVQFHVKPYRGELGTFEVGRGRRKIGRLSITGSLQGKKVIVPIGNLSPVPLEQWKTVRRYTLPVGDYTASGLNIEYGPLSISMSQNYHADGKPRGAMDHGPPLFAIKIRKDKPFVLDFSNEPEVMFASPAKDQAFAPGDEIKVAAVLIDPKLDLMIRELKRTPSVEEKKEAAAKKGGSLFDKVAEALGTAKAGATPETMQPPRPVSLDPIVRITDSSGKRVARGKMPFG